MSQVKTKSKTELIAVVRIRGSVDLTYEVKYTLKLLNLTRPNHAIVIPNDSTHLGMLQHVKDLITWGEIEKKTLIAMLEKRGRSKGNKKLDSKFLLEHKFDSIDDFATALLNGKADMRKIEDLKPIFRLHPPSKGYVNVKKQIVQGGDLGYRGAEINKLLERMI